MLFYTNVICEYSKTRKDGPSKAYREYTDKYEIFLRDDKHKFFIKKTTHEIDVDVNPEGANFSNEVERQEISFVDVKSEQVKNLLREIIEDTIEDDSYAKLREVYEELYQEKIIYTPNSDQLSASSYDEVDSEDEQEDEESDCELIFGSDALSNEDEANSPRLTPDLSHIKPCDDNGNLVFGDFEDLVSAAPQVVDTSVAAPLVVTPQAEDISVAAEPVGVPTEDVIHERTAELGTQDIQEDYFEEPSLSGGVDDDWQVL